MAFPPGFDVLAAIDRTGGVAGEALSDHGLILLPELTALDLDALGLEPWPDVAGRLRELDEQHRHPLATPRG
jgi:hypothetical protein